MKLFTEHPESIGETYTEHLLYACCKAWFVFKISIILFIHGVFPFWYKYEGSERIEQLCDELVKRKSGAGHEEDCSCDSDPQ